MKTYMGRVIGMTSLAAIAIVAPARANAQSVENDGQRAVCVRCRRHIAAAWRLPHGHAAGPHRRGHDQGPPARRHHAESTDGVKPRRQHAAARVRSFRRSVTSSVRFISPAMCHSRFR